MQTSSSSQDIQSTGMLSTRLAANAQASRDFDEWCLRQLPELPLSARILDLGCGTGKQIQLFSPLFPASADFYGIDLSTESLQRLRTQYQAAPALHLIEGSFDELPHFFEMENGTFDLIYGSYALYYTQDLPKLVRHVTQLLRPGGIFWVIAPYFGTNKEFLDILRPVHEVEPFMDYVFDRFHAEVIELCQGAGFQSIKPSLLRNTIPFADAASFMVYLRNSLFYRPGHDEAITQAVQEVVEREGGFRVSKNVISLQIRK
jgi:SAM-dependent methyltransferase